MMRLKLIHVSKRGPKCRNRFVGVSPWRWLCNSVVKRSGKNIRRDWCIVIFVQGKVTVGFINLLSSIHYSLCRYMYRLLRDLENHHALLVWDWYRWVAIAYSYHMMTSLNGNIFRVTGPLCGEFTGHRWIPRTKASDAEPWCFLWPTLA